MKKEKIIKNIMLLADIHHNIRINNWKRIPDDYDWTLTADMLVEDFVDSMRYEAMNDSGNRNLCKCEKKMKNGACDKHDLYHVYSYGRSGATLYWDKYWGETNTRGIFFKYDTNDLQDMGVAELKVTEKEMTKYNKLIDEMIESFYLNCIDEDKRQKEEAIVEEKKELEYQDIKKKVVENNFIKRLVNDII